VSFLAPVASTPVLALLGGGAVVNSGVVDEHFPAATLAFTGYPAGEITFVKVSAPTLSFADGSGAVAENFPPPRVSFSDNRGTLVEALRAPVVSMVDASGQLNFTLKPPVLNFNDGAMYLTLPSMLMSFADGSGALAESFRAIAIVRPGGGFAGFEDGSGVLAVSTSVMQQMFSQDYMSTVKVLAPVVHFEDGSGALHESFPPLTSFFSQTYMNATFPALTESFADGSGAVSLSFNAPDLNFDVPGGEIHATVQLAPVLSFTGVQITPDIAGIMTALYYGINAGLFVPEFPPSTHVGMNFAGAEGVVGSLDTHLPPPVAAFEGGHVGLTMSMPAPVTTFTALLGVSGSLATILPTLDPYLTAVAVPVGTMMVRAPRLKQSFVGLPGNVGEIALSFKPAHIALLAKIGVLGTMYVEPQVIRVNFSGGSTVSGTLQTNAPPAQISFTGMLTNVGDALSTYTLTIRTAALTTYDGFPFNGYAVIGGKYFGSCAAGIKQLDVGTTDDALPIPAGFTTGQLDFGDTAQKRCENFFIAGSFGGPVGVTATTDETATADYEVDTVYVDTLRQRRSPIGKGLRGRYWQFKVENTDGAELNFDSIIVDMVRTKRRV